MDTHDGNTVLWNGAYFDKLAGETDEQAKARLSATLDDPRSQFMGQQYGDTWDPYRDDGRNE